jgi:hypothetical protein
MDRYSFIIALRIIFAPLILVWPLQSIIVSFLLDVFDADVAHHKVSKKQYQVIDKILDSWVFLFELLLAWKLFPDFQLILLALFIWRMVGTIFFFINGYRWIFVIFGNYFENVFFVLYFKNFLPNIKLETLLVFSFIVKIIQEWFIHVAELSIREDLFHSKRKWSK